MLLKIFNAMFRAKPAKKKGFKVKIGRDHSFFVDRQSIIESDEFKRAMKTMDEWEKERNQARQTRENAAPKIATSAE